MQPFGLAGLQFCKQHNKFFRLIDSIDGIMQELRELGAIVFTDNSGKYQKSDSFPVGMKDRLHHSGLE